LQKREETEEEGGLPKSHPEKLCVLFWIIPKWLLVILFIVFVLALLDFSRIMDFVLIIAAIISLFPLIKIEDEPCTDQIVCIQIVLIIVAIPLMLVDKRYIIQIVLIIATIVFALMMVEKFKWIKDKKQNSIRTSKEECEKETLRDLDAWEIYKHADNLYHQRFNFFLVAESMLIVSFATLVDRSSTHTNSIRIAITILGMVFTFSWFYVNNRIDWRLNYLNLTFGVI
jgi:Ca2+/Na+ antiporter